MSYLFGNGNQYLNKEGTKRRSRLVFVVIALIVVAWSFVWILYTFLPTSFSVVIILFFLFIGIMKYLSRVGDKQFRWIQKADRGLQGEDDIARELEKLPASYTVYRNVQPRESFDIDFVIIGSNGAFTIEVKSHSGRVGYDGRELTLNNLPFKEKDVLRQAKQEALDVHEYLSRQLNRDVFVTPIIAFSSDYASLHFGMKQVNHAYVVQKKWLLDWITKMSGAVSDCEKINEALRLLVPRIEDKKHKS